MVSINGDDFIKLACHMSSISIIIAIYQKIQTKYFPIELYYSFKHAHIQVQQIKGIKVIPDKIFYIRFQSILCVFCHKFELLLKLKTYDMPI